MRAKPAQTCLVGLLESGSEALPEGRLQRGRELAIAIRTERSVSALHGAASLAVRVGEDGEDLTALHKVPRPSHRDSRDTRSRRFRGMTISHTRRASSVRKAQNGNGRHSCGLTE